MMLGLLAVGQVVVAEHDTGPAVHRLQRDDHAGGTGRDGRVVRPAPGEHQPVRRADLDELAARLDAAAHLDPVGAAGHRLQGRTAAHPLGGQSPHAVADLQRRVDQRARACGFCG
jgi:hypothetical protein